MGTLVSGLPDDSRYKKALAGVQVGLTDTLLALLVDQARILVWMETKDGHKNRNRPQSIAETLIFDKKEEKKEFRSIDMSEFEKERQRILREGR